MQTVTLRYSGVKADNTFKPWEKARDMKQLKNKVVKLGLENCRFEIDVAIEDGNMATLALSQQMGEKQSRFFTNVAKAELFINGEKIAFPQSFNGDILSVSLVEVKQYGATVLSATIK